MTIPSTVPLTLRPILHTADVDAAVDGYVARGARVINDDPMWTELQVGSGRLVVSILNRDAVEGQVDLGFETADLAAFEAALATVSGPRVEHFVTDDYSSARVVLRDGLDFLVDEPAADPAPGPSGDEVVVVVIATPTPPDTVADLEALGLVATGSRQDPRRLAAPGGGVVVVVAGQALRVTLPPR